MTCDHVIRPLKDPICMLPINGLPQEHTDKRYYSAINDLGYFFPKPGAFLEHKVAIDASDVVLEQVDPGESVMVYGFPSGHDNVQRGLRVSEKKKRVDFTSMTCISVTESPRYNFDLRCLQPTVRWVQGEFLDERLIQIRHDLVAQGFSGGPVFLSESRRLIGHVTHADKDSLFYTPISKSFDKMAKEKDFAHEIQT